VASTRAASVKVSDPVMTTGKVGRVFIPTSMTTSRAGIKVGRRPPELEVWTKLQEWD
jgi:hypothetical protein